MVDREQLKTAFAESIQAKNFVIPVFGENLRELDRVWQLSSLSHEERNNKAIEKRVLLHIAEWLGIREQVEPNASRDASRSNKGNPITASEFDVEI